MHTIRYAVLSVCAWFFMLAIHSTAQTTQDHPTGALPVPKEQYDLLPKAKPPVSGPLPDSVNLESYFPSPQNQGSSNACAAFAATTNKAYRMYMASGQRGTPDDYLQSPAFPYSAVSLRYATPKNPACVSGTQIYNELEFLAEVGSIPADDMPFRPNVCENWPAHMRNASNQSVSPYGTLWDSRRPDLALEQVKNLLAGGDPVVAGIYACQEFQHPINGWVSRMDPSGQGCGLHAVMIVGYDDRRGAVRILNSWGDGNTWVGSDGGKVWMTYDVLMGRWDQGYVDQGPMQRYRVAGSYKELAEASQGAVAEHPDASTSGTTTVTRPLALPKEVLVSSLRSNLGSKTGKTVHDTNGKSFDVARRYLWLDLPAEYSDQVTSVTYTLHDETFRSPFTTDKAHSSIFLVWWKGWDCVDSATVAAKLTNGTTVAADFNYCSLGQTNLPQ